MYVCIYVCVYVCICMFDVTSILDVHAPVSTDLYRNSRSPGAAADAQAPPDFAPEPRGSPGAESQEGSPEGGDPHQLQGMTWGSSNQPGISPWYPVRTMIYQYNSIYLHVVPIPYMILSEISISPKKYHEENLIFFQEGSSSSWALALSSWFTSFQLLSLFHPTVHLLTSFGDEIPLLLTVVSQCPSHLWITTIPRIATAILKGVMSPSFK